MLIEKKKDEVEELMKNVQHDNETDIKRVCLIIELYQLLKEKYIFDSTDIINILKKYYFVDKEDIDKLEMLLDKDEPVETLKHIFSLMKKLNDIIFSHQRQNGHAADGASAEIRQHPWPLQRRYRL